MPATKNPVLISSLGYRKAVVRHCTEQLREIEGRLEQPSGPRWEHSLAACEDLGGVGRVFELNVSETSASTILEAFDLGRSGGTILTEEIKEFLLSDFDGKVANKKVGLSVKFLTSRFLNRYSEVLSLQFKVVHLVASVLSSFL